MTDTPPPSTLSTPSPTEHDPWNQKQDQAPSDDPTHQSNIPSTAALLEMNTFKQRTPIHLLVATSLKPHLGIGHQGQLPWPPLKSDMAFFRKATTGKPPSPQINATIMGRKTYLSIPQKFRPLADRVNVILTRSDVRRLAEQILKELSEGQDTDHPAVYRLVDRATVAGLSSEMVSIVKRDHEQATVVVTNSVAEAMGVEARDVFCIGGAEVYSAVLEEMRHKAGGTVRVMQTLVRKVDGGQFECDTFWPEEMKDGVDGWKEVDSRTVEEWAGVQVPQGREEWLKEEKAGVEIRVVGWERESLLSG